jgi:hypothetical protein
MEAVNHKRPILTYPIASGKMYYVVANERAVYLQGAPEAGFSLCGPNVEQIFSVVAPTSNGR